VRILHVSDCYLPRLGGIERQVRALAVLQRRSGHEVEVVTSTACGSSDDDAVTVRRPPLRRHGRPGDIRYEWSRAGRKLVLAGRVDVVHVHASAFSPLGFLTAASTAGRGIPTAVTMHSLWAYASPLFRIADALSGWTRWQVAWSAVSATAAAPLQQMIGPATPVAILPNGVDARAWRVVPTPRSRNRIVIATVGRLVPRKRPRGLLRMLQRARERLPAGVELEAIIIGEGPLRPSLERSIAQHGMTQWVRLEGAADHERIRRIYEGVDFYVAPATLESFGIAALEARAAGLPVVGFAASGIADFIRDDVEGLLATDDDDMVTKILRLTTSPSTLERMRQHNMDEPPTITWAEVLENCGELYEQAQKRAAEGAAKTRAKHL
jgi:glycosyltransferase involved in cell wall biosynthesis